MRPKRNKHPFSVDYQTKPGKAVIRYLRYRYFHRYQYLCILLFCVLFLMVSILSVYSLGMDYILGSIAISLILLSFFSLPWWLFVDMENKKLVERIIFPIIDKRLSEIAKRFPEKYSVAKRILIKDSKFIDGERTMDLKVLVAFSGGDVYEYPFPFITSERKDGVYIRELSLTNYLCTNKKELAQYSQRKKPKIDKVYAFCISAIVLFVGIAIMFPSFLFINTPEDFKKFCFSIIVVLVLLALSGYLSNRLNNTSRTLVSKEI